MYLRTVFCFFGLFSLARSQTTPVSQCIRHEGELPMNVYIENCPTPPCQLPQLQDVVLHIVFQAPYLMHSMKTLATAYLIGPIGISYNLNENAITCNFLTNTYCPVLKDEIITYTLKMYIESWMASGISVTVEFRIVDDNENPIMCIRVPLTIIDPLPTAFIAGPGVTNGTLVINSIN